MRNNLKTLFSHKCLLFTIFLYLAIVTNSQKVIEISEDIPNYSDYKKASFSSEGTTPKFYFKHTMSVLPKSRINAIRFDFASFDELSKQNEVFCTSFDESESDEEMIKQLDILTKDTSSCIGAFKDRGVYDGIIEYDEKKKKLGVVLVIKSEISFSASVYLRINDKSLKTSELNVRVDETYSLVPCTLIIPDFRESASKILFYSKINELQMYYVATSAPYPEKLFSGNIMNVYTNPFMVQQKYKGASTMVLLTRNFTAEEIITLDFKFEIKLFPSNYLLDYYMSDNPDGRSKNTPLSINMTDCENPYYVILNYNKPKKETSLYIDQIYGKMKNLTVATTFTKRTWDEMLENDMEMIDMAMRHHVLPKFSESHIDVYKVECEIPSLMNFYYIDDKAEIPKLNYGKVAITILKPNKFITFPFEDGVLSPELTIEIFNPVEYPMVFVDDGQNPRLVTDNALIKTKPYSGRYLILREKGGFSNTRIIVKVGYNIGGWKRIDDTIKYNEDINMFVFSFPNNEDQLKYISAEIITKGKNAGDNVKYCYGTNIGNAILPSKENCYRVSAENGYTLKVLNPFIMPRDYKFEEKVFYYVSIKPVEITQEMTVSSTLTQYDTEERNKEGVANIVTISGDKKDTILTAPEGKEEQIFLQIQQCSPVDIEFEVKNTYYPSQIVVEKTKIPSTKKNFFKMFNNVYLETELELTGASNTDVFVKHIGIREGYEMKIKEKQEISFNPELNQLLVDGPLQEYERIKIVVFVDKKGALSNQGITLCTVAQNKTVAKYNKTIEIYNEDKIPININFKKVGLEKDQEFEAIVYTEQMYGTKMAFLSDIFTGTVGEIKTESVKEIKDTYSEDKDYVFIKDSLVADKSVYYYYFTPKEIFDVPIGAFSIEADPDMTSEFINYHCAFVDDGEDAMTMVEAVEEVVEYGNSYCQGGRSSLDKNKYKFIFKYSYNGDQPRRLVIRLTNTLSASGSFTIYVRNAGNINIEKTSFDEEKEYGKQEEYKKSVIPYIVDLKAIRGDSATDYVSKLLIYSQFLELQMYYLDPENVLNYPLELFSGNIMLVYTNPNLAGQKYRGTKLILLSENLSGQEHSSLGNKFRFHTKMFRSDDQIEYFVSEDMTGRTLNKPLSLEMNICTSSNNKYYYILNYNRAEDKRILYLDMIFGSMKRAKIASEINEQKWSELIKNGMEVIEDYKFTLKNKTQHIDVFEIECNTPLFANVYYNEKDQEFSDLTVGDVAIQYIDPKNTATITIDTTTISGIFYYSISAFNPQGNPDLTFNFGKNVQKLTENSVQAAYLAYTPDTISIRNNGGSPSRFILKIGYPVDFWTDEKAEVEGTLFSNENKYVYRFPRDSNKRNFTNVTFYVKPMIVHEVEAANIKFCYSTSIGMPIAASRENCFRTGANIPISLTYINPIISTKNYKDYTDSYFVTFEPYNDIEYIRLEIAENKYEVEERNVEGIGNIVKLDDKKEKSTILTISPISRNNVVLELQFCNPQGTELKYSVLNAYTQQIINTGTLKKASLIYTLKNQYMETQVKFNGQLDDSVFVKHMGVSNYEPHIEIYGVTFDKTKNEAKIVKPISYESFRFTVLVGKSGRFKDYTLCTFAEKPESKYSELGDYVYTFDSVSSNVIPHYIDFRSFGYNEGDPFDLVVYSVQKENSTLEFLSDVIHGAVGKVDGIITEIKGKIPGQDNYVTEVFEKNSTNNYLYYTFTNPQITGEVATIKIRPVDGSSLKVSKIGCVFVKKSATDSEMVSEVNKAVREGKSVCVGETEIDNNGFDALVNAKDVANSFSKLVIQVIYGLGEEENEEQKLNITLRTCGMKVKENIGYDESEELAMIPYVLDLKEIRGDDTKENYVSKVLLYSTNHEMQMFYLKSGAPKELFSGNIMLAYTNPKVIIDKYSGANTMILLTDSLSAKKNMYWGEQFKFKANFFDSKSKIEYFVSANKTGRYLNNPTSIEMDSCDQPYYYILNYNKNEEERILHIDNIFGEVEITKIATYLNDPDWNSFVASMKQFKGNEFSIAKQSKYHLDILEVTCKTPLLLNIYYTDPKNPKISNLDQGDISLISLDPGKSQKLSFVTGLTGEFVYSFNVQRQSYYSPDLLIKFADGDSLPVDMNGIFIRKTNKNYPTIEIVNQLLEGSEQTKVIFKFGYDIEKTFKKIQNDMYQLQDEDKTVNLFAYIFKHGEDRLNYTKVNFAVSTSQSNVKFCYSTNLGAFIDPSLQNCKRVSPSNPYTITLLNPYIMFKSYYTGEETLPYFVSFRTEEKDQNITIKPTIVNYHTKNRNMVGYPNSIEISKTGSTILTVPENNGLYIYVQLSLCSSESVSYEFKNAFYNTSLSNKGELQPSQKHAYLSIPNSNLDTEILFEANNYNKRKIFVKHIGTTIKYTPIIQKIEISFNSGTHELSFNTPISGEEIKYTIYIDKKDYLKKQNYTLCSIVEVSKLAHYSQSMKSQEDNVVVKIDFDQEELKGYEYFDLLILAEEVNRGKLMILSDVYQNYIDGAGDGPKTSLIIILSILGVVLIGGGVFAYFCIKKLRTKPLQNVIIAKPTTLDDISGANQGEKMLDSMAQSQASENAMNN